MKYVSMAMIVLVCTFGLYGCAGKAKMKSGGGSSVSAILSSANVSLSADQEKQLKAINAQTGRESFRTIYEIFTEKQLDALNAAFGSSPGREGGPERPRFLLFAVIFENENCPLTAEQLAALKALPNDRGAFQKMGEVFTEQQSALMQKMFNR